ncbi:MAG: hypothetical protein K0S35_1476, partial [Geminicoccaceae bacterium]|nr:hypothetical protein [Geminicoccaceae bacterium]
QSWLASGAVAIDPTVVDWLDAQIVDLEPAQIARIEIRPDSGASYVIRREGADEPLQLADLAEGEALKPDADLDRLAAAFADLRFKDVKPRRELAWPEAHHSATAVRFDGVELTVQLARIDDELWAIIDAREPPAARPAPADAATAAPASTGDTEAVEIDDPAAAPEDTAEPPPLTAGEINERVQSWAYKVPDLVFDRLTQPRSKWLEDAGTS